jgi:hypothetical protein
MSGLCAAYYLLRTSSWVKVNDRNKVIKSIMGWYL